MFREASTRRVILFTTNLVVAEVHRLLLYRAGIQPAARAIDHIATSALVRLEFATLDHHRSARAWLAKLADQQITYADAVSFAVMEATRCTAVASFDHDFTLAGFFRWQP